MVRGMGSREIVVMPGSTIREDHYNFVQFRQELPEKIHFKETAHRQNDRIHTTTRQLTIMVAEAERSRTSSVVCRQQTRGSLGRHVNTFAFSRVKPNTHRRRDSTRQLSRVGGVYWASVSHSQSSVFNVPDAEKGGSVDLQLYDSVSCRLKTQ